MQKEITVGALAIFALLIGLAHSQWLPTPQRQVYATNNQDSATSWSLWGYWSYAKNQTVTYSNTTITPVPGLKGVLNLKPGSPPEGDYFATLVSNLQELGYSQDDILAFTYDWRQPTTFGPVPFSLASFISKACRTTGPVDIISHGTGGLLVNAALVNYNITTANGQSCVNRWITLGTPFLGIDMKASILGFLGNGNLSLFFPGVKSSAWTNHQLLISSAPFYEMAIEPVFNWQITQPPNFTWVDQVGKTHSYSSNMTDIITNVVISANAANTVQPPYGGNYPAPFQWGLYNLALSQRTFIRNAPLQTVPGAFCNIYGILKTTENQINFTLPSSPANLRYQVPKYVRPTDSSGDGIVPDESALNHNMRRAGIPVVDLGFYNVHQELVTDGMIFASIRKFLGLDPSMEGNWDLDIVDGLPQTIYLKQVGWYVSSVDYKFNTTCWAGWCNGTLLGTYGDGPFSWDISQNATYFYGWWQYPWSGFNLWSAEREIGQDCSPSKQRTCRIVDSTNTTIGVGQNQCEFGYWSSTCYNVTCFYPYQLLPRAPVNQDACVLTAQHSEQEEDREMVVYFPHVPSKKTAGRH